MLNKRVQCTKQNTTKHSKTGSINSCFSKTLLNLDYFTAVFTTYGIFKTGKN